MTKRYIFGLVVLVSFFFGVFFVAAVDTEALNQLADIQKRMAKAMDHEDYDEALKISLEIEELGLDPAELFAGEYEDAMEEIKRGRDEYLYVYWYRGRIYTVAYKDIENALKAYDIVYRYQHNPSYFVFTYYAEALRKIGHKDQAEQVLLNGLTLLDQSNHPRIYLSLGRYAYIDGEYEKTVRCGEKSYVIDPDLAAPLFNAATALFVLERNKDALGWFGLGLAALYTGDERNRRIAAASTDSFENIEVRYPKNIGIKTALSVMYAIEGKVEQLKRLLPTLVKEETLLPYLLSYITAKQAPEFYWPIIQCSAVVEEKELTNGLLSLLFFGINNKESLIKWVNRIEENGVVKKVISMHGWTPFTEEWIVSMAEGIRSLRDVSGNQQQNDPYKAIIAYRKSLKAFHQVSQYHTGWYSLVLSNLASMYYSMGRYREAEPLYEEAMSIWKDLPPKGKHPNYAASLNNLVALYKSMGMYGEAEPLYEELMAILKELPPKGKHPYYATSLNNLAGLYDSMGSYGEAEPLYKEAMAIFKELPPKGKHPAYATKPQQSCIIV